MQAIIQILALLVEWLIGQWVNKPYEQDDTDAQKEVFYWKTRLILVVVFAIAINTALFYRAWMLTLHLDTSYTERKKLEDSHTKLVAEAVTLEERIRALQVNCLPLTRNKKLRFENSETRDSASSPFKGLTHDP